MSSPNKHEDHRRHHYTKCEYSRLSNIWTYSCPPKNPVYSSINNGYNCLCSGNIVRSSFDQAMIDGKTWPASNDKLGWK